jgi:MBG domain-containing protein
MAKNAVGTAPVQTFTLTLTPALLTVTANNATRQYGQANPTFTGTITDLQNGDNITATYSTTATRSSNAGSYAITPTLLDPGNKLGNYAVTVNNGTLTVTPAPLTVTAPTLTKILNAPNPAINNVTYSGFQLADGPGSVGAPPACTTAATTTSPVGSYPITCSGLTSSNYNIQYVAGTLKILYASGGICDGDAGHQILQPVNADGTSVWKQGRTIPLKFRVCDANGVSIGSLGVISSFALTQIISGTVTNVDETIDAPAADSGFRFDPTAQQWIFNLGTSSQNGSYTYVYSISLNDGTIITFQYGLR